jgi:thioredoxin 1
MLFKSQEFFQKRKKMASNSLKYLTDENFEQEVAKGIVLVDFYADWCGPCKMIEPVVVELAQEMAGKVTVAKIDTDKAVNAATKYEVTSIPTLILFKNGEVVERVVGVKDLDYLRKLVQSVI